MIDRIMAFIEVVLLAGALCFSLGLMTEPEIHWLFKILLAINVVFSILGIAWVLKQEENA